MLKDKDLDFFAADAIRQHQRGVAEENARLRPLLEKLEAALSPVVYDSDMKRNRWKLWHGCKDSLADLRRELGKEPA